MSATTLSTLGDDGDSKAMRANAHTRQRVQKGDKMYHAGWLWIVKNMESRLLVPPMTVHSHAMKEVQAQISLYGHWERVNPVVAARPYTLLNRAPRFV